MYKRAQTKDLERNAISDYRNHIKEIKQNSHSAGRGSPIRNNTSRVLT